MAALLILLLQLALVIPVTVATTVHGTAVTTAVAPPPPAAHRSAHATTATAVPAARRVRPSLRGADISWPNCPKGEGIPQRRTKGEPMPERHARFVVVGLTNGPGFSPNPCLARELAWVHAHHRLLAAYAMTTYPNARQIRQHQYTGPYDGSRTSGRLRNAGYAEASYNVRELVLAAMTVPMVWIDVEPYPTFPWSGSHRANRAIIRGAIRGYRDAGYPVGIYTYANGWAQVVGSWRLPGLPTWTTAGHGGARQARAMCHRGPSGGRTWLSQWYTTHRDYDLTCPGAPRRNHLFR